MTDAIRNSETGVLFAIVEHRGWCPGGGAGGAGCICNATARFVPEAEFQAAVEADNRKARRAAERRARKGGGR